ncbi:RNA polymerase sigma-70 factor (ECF subfamily) [Pedobacter sp. CAN_A7]|uniref:RNA polymerase sigma factor n=1 Tax=Pedobacter sp. CAN_A7 TaxID=2787722 RepID=UPI0018C9E650
MDVKAQRSVDKNNLLFQDIIDGLESQDKRIQERIYVHYWGYLMGVAARYVKDRGVAKEIVNDSFIKAFKSMYDFKHNYVIEDFQKTFKAWLATITVRTALDKIRKDKSPLSFVESYDNLQIEHVAVDDRLHVEDIMKLLFQLPDLHRTVFNLYEIEGFSHDEISKLLEIPTSSSRTYLTRAKQKLRELYTNTIQLTDGNSR